MHHGCKGKISKEGGSEEDVQGCCSVHLRDMVECEETLKVIPSNRKSLI